MTVLAQFPPVVVAVAAGLVPLCVTPAPSVVGYGPAATVLTLEGARLGPDLPDPWNDSVDGSLCKEADSCIPVDYMSDGGPVAIPDGIAALDKALADTDGQKVVLGYSQGALVASQWISENAGNPDAPDPSEVSFVLMGNLTRAHGGMGRWIGLVMPQNQYQVTDVTRQYDPLGDFPDDPTNLVALANAAAGYVFVHTDYTGVDIDDPGNVTWTEGNTTYVFVPTKNLPLLEPLRMMGMDTLADELNEPLKRVVEAGYDRDLPETDATDETAGGSATYTSGGPAAHTSGGPAAHTSGGPAAVVPDPGPDGPSAAPESTKRERPAGRAPIARQNVVRTMRDSISSTVKVQAGRSGDSAAGPGKGFPVVEKTRRALSDALDRAGSRPRRSAPE